MSLKSIFWLIVKIPFKLLKFAILILAAIGGDANAGSIDDNSKIIITDYQTNRTLYKIQDNYIGDYQTGRYLYKINGDYIEDYQTGRWLYKINDNYIEDYQTGRWLYKINGNYIEDYQTGRYLYKIEGKINDFVILVILINEGLLDQD